MSVLVQEQPTVPLEDISHLGLLGDELQVLSEKFQAVPEQVQEIFLNHLREWKDSDLLHDALKEGDVAPDFVLPDQDGNLISSVDLRAKGPIVVIFFRGQWCSYCNATLRMIRKYTAHFKARGATVVAISPQTIDQSKVTRNNAGLTFPVLSDQGSEYSQLLNIAYVLDDNVKTILEGAAGKKFSEMNGPNDYDATVLPVPATYVIQTNGQVTYSFLDTDFTKRAEPVDILNALPPLSRRRLSLSERIEVEMGKLRDSHPELQMRILFDAVDRLRAQGIEGQALKVGEKAPDFSFLGRDGERISSRKLRRNGPLVVTFHYGHQSPLCMLQLEAMQRYLSKLEAKGASVVAIAAASNTTTPQSSSGAASYYTGAKFPLMQDGSTSDSSKSKSVAKQFGLLYKLPTGHLFGRADDHHHGEIELPMAATYVIDGQSGTILYAFVNADPTQRAEPSDILKAIPTKFQRQAPAKRGPFSLLFGGRLAARANKRARRNL
jgi:peroxiredoxin